MKLILPAIVLLASSTMAFAKSEQKFNKFNKQMMNNISTVLKDNPELYETKSISRKPASVSPTELQKDTTQKLDKFDEQADGTKSW
mgnify:FL=1